MKRLDVMAEAVLMSFWAYVIVVIVASLGGWGTALFLRAVLT